jgi:hypothetical protein
VAAGFRPGRGGSGSAPACRTGGAGCRVQKMRGCMGGAARQGAGHSYAAGQGAMGRPGGARAGRRTEGRGALGIRYLVSKRGGEQGGAGLQAAAGDAQGLWVLAFYRRERPIRRGAHAKNGGGA